MKNYKAPEVEIDIFDIEDIITVSSTGSGTSSNPDELPDDEWN